MPALLDTRWVPWTLANERVEYPFDAAMETRQVRLRI
jgi:hypothetical protein